MFAASSPVLHARLRGADLSDPASMSALLLDAGIDTVDNELRRCLLWELRNESAPFHRFLLSAIFDLSEMFHRQQGQVCCVMCLAAATGDCELLDLLLRQERPHVQSRSKSVGAAGEQYSRRHDVQMLTCAVANGQEGAAALCAAAMNDSLSVTTVFLGQLNFLLNFECSEIDSGSQSRTEFDLLSSVQALLAVCSDDADERRTCVELLLLTPILKLGGHGTILHFAVKQSFHQLLRLVVTIAAQVAKKADASGIVPAIRIPALNSCDAHGLTPLAIAVNMRDLCAVRILLTHGASPFRPCLQSVDASTWTRVSDWPSYSVAAVDQRMMASLACDEVAAGRHAVAHLRSEALCEDLGDKLQLSVCASSAAAALANLAEGVLKKRRTSGQEDFPDEALRVLLAAIDVDPWNPAASTLLNQALRALSPDLYSEWQHATSGWSSTTSEVATASNSQGRVPKMPNDQLAEGRRLSLTPPHVNVQIGIDCQVESMWIALPSADAMERLFGARTAGATGREVECPLETELCGVVCSVTANGCPASKGDLVFFTASAGVSGSASLAASRIVRRGPVIVRQDRVSGRSVLRRVQVGSSPMEACDTSIWLNPPENGEEGPTLVIDQLRLSAGHRERWASALEHRGGRSVWVRELANAFDGSSVKCCELLDDGLFPSGTVLIVHRDTNRIIGVDTEH